MQVHIVSLNIIITYIDMVVCVRIVVQLPNQENMGYILVHNISPYIRNSRVELS